MFTFAAIGAFLKGVPWRVWLVLIIAAVVGFGFWAYGESRYRAGQAERQGAWDAATTAQAEADRRLEGVQSSISVASQVRTVERVKVIRETGQTITKLVPVYVPAVDLPGGLRLLHDAAAAGQVPDATGGIDAAPVPAQVFAATVSDNYAGCRENATRIEEWQTWVREQQEASERAL
jgi:cell division protein FtsW (lipid II flippase)